MTNATLLDRPLDSAPYFSADYAAARRLFRDMAQDRGARLAAYKAPVKGAAGEDLTVDTAWFGRADAPKVVVLTSAVHGVEGFCGSACQADFMAAGVTPAEDTAVLLVHALNPYGFSWLRRVTQENVDLNRNGIDFSLPPPANPGYDVLHDAFAGMTGDAGQKANAQAAIAAFRAEHGDHAFNLARSAGQYIDDRGIHFGGFGPTWSRLTLETLIADNSLAGRRQVAVIDYHTGLGPHGYGEPICGCRPTEPGRDRAYAWYGDSLTEPLRGTSTSVVIPGLVQYVWLRELGAEALTFIALEFGTYPRDVMMAAADWDNWLHLQQEPDLGGETARRIKADIRRAYFPDTLAWRQMVLFRSRQILAQTFLGLAGC